MNEAEKERLIKKDIESVENRVRHAFNQGYEMGLKESCSEIPNTCGDAISRKAVLDLAEWFYINQQHFIVANLIDEVENMPSVTPQQRTGRWERMSDLPNDVDDRFECSRCGNVVHHRSVMDLRTFNRWCGRCGSENDYKKEMEE